MVGQQAMLEGRSVYGVDGLATIVDDCTIRIDNFSYNGGGIVVEFYAGLDGEYSASSGGFSLSEDLRGTRFSGETVTLTLPEDTSLDDFNGLSVWCVTAGIDFGSGLFQ